MVVRFAELDAVDWRSLDCRAGFVVIGVGTLAAVRDRVFIAGADASIGVTARFRRFGVARAMNRLVVGS